MPPLPSVQASTHSPCLERENAFVGVDGFNAAMQKMRNERTPPHECNILIIITFYYTVLHFNILTYNQYDTLKQQKHLVNGHQILCEFQVDDCQPCLEVGSFPCKMEYYYNKYFVYIRCVVF